MPTDAATKGLLFVIATSTAVLAYQSVTSDGAPDYPDQCGYSAHSPCFIIAAEADGLRIASGAGGVGEQDPIFVRIAD